MHADERADSRTIAIAGITIAANTAIMVITTSSSIRVKAWVRIPFSLDTMYFQIKPDFANPACGFATIGSCYRRLVI